jgi:hypothetical protein
MKVNKEVWRQIINYENYYSVSSSGAVKSIRKGSILKPEITNRGYERVCLSVGGRVKRLFVHRLVATAFLKNENKPCVNHKDANKRNNRVENLEWCSVRENVKHAVENNLYPLGEKASSNKLKKKDVLEIRRKYSRKVYHSVILAEEYNVDPKTIRNIINGENWSWLESAPPARHKSL